MNNTILLIGGGLLAAYLLSRQGGMDPTGGAPSPQHFFVPSAGWVHQSQLPAMGYIFWNGQWYHQTQFQVPQTGQFAGTNPNSPQWLNILNGVLSTTGTLANFFISNSGSLFGGGSGSGQGGQGGTGSSQGQGGQGIQSIGQITKSPQKNTFSVCANGRYTSNKNPGRCSYNGGVLYNY
jgi:hypothetical protein